MDNKSCWGFRDSNELPNDSQFEIFCLRLTIAMQKIYMIQDLPLGFNFWKAKHPGSRNPGWILKRFQNHDKKLKLEMLLNVFFKFIQIISS